MMDGVTGRLVTSAFLSTRLAELDGFTPMPARTAQTLEAWGERTFASVGPASSARAIADAVVVPLLALLGYDILVREDGDGACWLGTSWQGRRGPVVLVVAWGDSLSHAWRQSVLRAVASDTRWCLCANGPLLRAIDARRTWSRDFLEFDLQRCAMRGDPQAVMWALLRAEAVCGSSALLERSVELSARYAHDVCRALGAGVIDALGTLVESAAASTRRGRRAPLTALFAESLTVLYRVLFLLFAEARGLVPLWHPIYRDSYSVESIVTTLLRRGVYRGLWHTLAAISRLAHAGCAAGELRVAPFNGRLFAPAAVAALEHLRIDDRVMGRAVVAIGTTPASHGQRRRIAYGDLDVEQLGAVYERVLDYEPSPQGLRLTRDVRKASGTFYTPRPITAFLVRRTLDPLVEGRSAHELLSLRIVDPAMGSGAFLVAACRYLAAVVEEALVREGRWHPGDVTASDRVMLRREIASRCLYGVDVNPTAVQLARLSLWLATLAADRPLSFLDHRLVAGDSLVGARLEDLARQPSRGSGRVAHREALPLFDDGGLELAMSDAATVRDDIAQRRDDSAAIVRAKEQQLAALARDDSPLRRWMRVMDLWCAGWFWSDGRPPDRSVAAVLRDYLLRDRGALPRAIAGPLLAYADEVAGTRRFLHWPLAFPEVFATGGPAPPGFDAVIGNPPWDMVRGDSGAGDLRGERQRDARQMIEFVREAGIYRVAAQAHVNRYQLFVERALQLVRPGGRVGLVLPAGVASDAGAAPLRRHLFARADVDSLTGLDNRAGIFPIHRGVRFALLTCTAGRSTTSVACRFGVTDADDLDMIRVEPVPPLVLSRSLLARLSGEDDLGVPEVATPLDLRIVERVSASVPRTGDERGWNLRFGRELNASDDRHRLAPISGRPERRVVIEGKHLEPFRVALDRAALEVAPEHVDRVRVPRRPRIAYRDVASATNRLTLIAAIVPARVVTTHTLFCLKTALPPAAQRVVCALLNSFVANYLIRLRVNTHVTVALVARLPLPVVSPGEPMFDRLAALAATLSGAVGPAEQLPEYAELQALAAHAYALTRTEFEHVLGTFPLIPESVRRASYDAFVRLA